MTQNPELDSLRIQAEKNPKTRLFKCAQCHAFARYGMIDSAKICLTESRFKKTKSVEVELSLLLTEALLSEITNNESLGLSIYDSAFTIIAREKPAFRISKKAYLQAFEFYRYYSWCEEGAHRAAQFVALCQEEQNDSLLLLSLLQEIEMRE